jgi:hypothetical protein
VYLEACGELAGTALTFAVRVGSEWLSSDRGVEAYRIVRDGCFRGAVPLPAPATLADVRALRVQVFARDGQRGTDPARVTRINRLFALDELYIPGASVLQWEGTATIGPGGPPLELPVP